ncbi:MAG: PEP-CTERM sorting domain-containing protein [Nitrospirota bacterium]
MRPSRVVVVFSFVVMILSIAVTSSTVLAAAFSRNEVHIDWSSLRITTDPGVSISLTNNFDNLNWAIRASIYNVIPGWQDAIAQSYFEATGGGSAYGIASTNASGMHLFTAAETHGPGDMFSYAMAYRGAEFRVSGTGTVGISIDYHFISDSAVTPGSPTDHASGITWADLFMGGNYTEALHGSGTLSMNAFYSDGDTDIIRIGSYADSTAATLGPLPTPEPPTLILLGAGLAGVSAFRKKFTRRIH